ncbi:MAG: SusC/RagA family TonB-linked outer membrane protein, partial [Sphingobacteriaceae bacterium]
MTYCLSKKISRLKNFTRTGGLLAIAVLAAGSATAFAAPVAPLAITMSTNANAITITGTVTDNKGLPLPGVSVTEKGTTNGITTDANGNFTLNVANPSSVLVFKYIGYTGKEVAVGTQTSLTVSLTEDVTALNEVVVVGYGTQRKKDVTGSVSSANMKELGSLPVPDIGQAVQGRVAGIQAVTSGAPGSNVTLRVRGVGTINNADPLLVIDGVPTDVPLNTLNTDDIASFDVLKDA